MNSNRNHDLQVVQEEYDPIKHFMEIQQASTLPREKSQEPDLNQMGQEELEEMLTNIKEQLNERTVSSLKSSQLAQNFIRKHHYEQDRKSQMHHRTLSQESRREMMKEKTELSKLVKEQQQLKIQLYCLQQ